MTPTRAGGPDVTLPPANHEATASLREVYQMIDKVRVELGGKIDNLATSVNATMSAHYSEHEKHDEQHKRDHDRRSSLIRWAVTSILSGVGVIVALYVAFRHGG